MSDARWLVLVHRIPPSPTYSRVRAGRLLHRFGAVAIKNSVYVLPADAPTRGELVSLAREIMNEGGDAVVCEARFVEGLSDESVEALFRSACDREYAAVVRDVKALTLALRGSASTRADRARRLENKLRRLKRRFDDAVGRDRFVASGREVAARSLALAEDLLEGVERKGRTAGGDERPPRGATWVTRAGIMADRIASAWLIRRFIDPDARFRFVHVRTHASRRDELRFDMAGAEFTHDADRCTFEVLVERFRLRDVALRPIAEIVHDIDLEDMRYRRPEAAAIEKLIAGFAVEKASDEIRLSRGVAALDHLYDSFQTHRTEPAAN